MRCKSSLAFVCNYSQLRAFHCYHSRKLPISNYICPCEIVLKIGKNGLGKKGGLGFLVAFLAHIEAEGKEGDDGGEGDGGDPHGDDDFGEAERRRKAKRDKGSKG